MTMVADAGTREILGAAIPGIEGDEAIHGILDVMNGRNDSRLLPWAVPIRPSGSGLIPTWSATSGRPDRQAVPAQVRL